MDRTPRPATLNWINNAQVSPIERQTDGSADKFLFRLNFKTAGLRMKLPVARSLIVPLKTTTTIKILAAAIAASGIAAGVAFALPAYSVETYYYSDAAKTEEVGSSVLTCNGNYTLHGRETTYSTVQMEYCGNTQWPN